jgi:hypothetical protein
VEQINLMHQPEKTYETHEHSHLIDSFGFGRRRDLLRDSVAGVSQHRQHRAGD